MPVKFSDRYQQALCDGEISISVNVKDQLVDDVQLAGLDIHESMFTEVVFNSVYFEYMDLDNVVFKKCTFIDCYFHSCKLNNVVFVECSPAKPSIGNTCTRGSVSYYPSEETYRKSKLGHDMEKKLSKDRDHRPDNGQHTDNNTHAVGEYAAYTDGMDDDDPYAYYYGYGGYEASDGWYARVTGSEASQPKHKYATRIYTKGL